VGLHRSAWLRCRQANAGRSEGPKAKLWEAESERDLRAKVKGKKRHVLVDTLGLLLHAVVTSANVQDRDGGLMVLSTMFGQFPFLTRLFADSTYAGPVFHNGLASIMPCLVTEIVRRSDRAKGFVMTKRWIPRSSPGTERTIGWLGRCRRLAKDWENLNHNALALPKLWPLPQRGRHHPPDRRHPARAER